MRWLNTQPVDDYCSCSTIVFQWWLQQTQIDMFLLKAADEAGELKWPLAKSGPLALNGKVSTKSIIHTDCWWVGRMCRFIGLSRLSSPPGQRVLAGGLFPNEDEGRSPSGPLSGSLSTSTDHTAGCTLTPCNAHREHPHTNMLISSTNRFLHLPALLSWTPPLTRWKVKEGTWI